MEGGRWQTHSHFELLSLIESITKLYHKLRDNCRWNVKRQTNFLLKDYFRHQCNLLPHLSSLYTGEKNITEEEANTLSEQYKEYKKKKSTWTILMINIPQHWYKLEIFDIPEIEDNVKCEKEAVHQERRNKYEEWLSKLRRKDMSIIICIIRN